MDHHCATWRSRSWCEYSQGRRVVVVYSSTLELSTSPSTQTRVRLICPQRVATNLPQEIIFSRNAPLRADSLRCDLFPSFPVSFVVRPVPSRRCVFHSRRPVTDNNLISSPCVRVHAAKMKRESFARRAIAFSFSLPRGTLARPWNFPRDTLSNGPVA